MPFNKVTNIIPAFNESATIKKIIARLMAVDFAPLTREIIVVDDGSTDGTRELLQQIPGIRYIFHERNRGKGGAVKTGFAAATGDIVTVQDADLEYDPADLPKVLRPILEGKTEVTNGVRIQPARDERRRKSLYWLSWLGNHAITLTTNILYGVWLGEYEGCYKAFTKNAIAGVSIRTDSFDYDNELVCKLLRRGFRVAEAPIRYNPRRYEEGKKITWRDGLRILWTITQWRVRPF